MRHDNLRHLSNNDHSRKEQTVKKITPIAQLSSHLGILQLQQIIGNRNVINLMSSVVQRTGEKETPEERKPIHVPFGYGMSGSMEKYNFYSTNFHSCNAIAMFNEKTKDGGLFHLLGKGVDRAKKGLTDMFANILPTTITLYNGSDPMYNGSDPTTFSNQLHDDLVKDWKDDHDKLKELFSKCEIDFNYAKQGKQLEIIREEDKQTSNLTMVMNDKQKYEGLKDVGSIGIDGIEPPMDSALSENYRKKFADEKMPIYESEKNPYSEKEEEINLHLSKEELTEDLGQWDE